ncbi:ACP S-malonyltransferase [Allonocardiopsis opalescens]|uniref:[acyl-carrier-protein] S-malonyltransferase n=1 Tax=Allonocardiopsis opalescens TaxID=1144618 RepID=A0A2T0QCX7_9ACTN|nr:acyltransferase domain-containing protein [Allonocardiopsis opalescens]PRY01752.1 [acyl-carrier-protein] S-malonyltransferase [Allonocardiopsis opalescens]
METDARPRTAVVFPGMGPSQYADVSRFMLVNPVARRLVAAAGEALGYSLVDRYREAEGDYSEYAQVAFLVNCLALAEWARDALGVEPELCAGPSFGGKAAAAHAGTLAFPDAVRLTARLARLMEDYFGREHRDAVTLSFVRTPEPALAEILAEMDERGEWYDIACRIDEDFHMVTLREGGLERMQARLRAVGGLPLYSMRPPLHSAAFAGLRRRAEEEVFADFHFADPKLPVVSDHDGSVLTSAEQVRTLLLDGIVRALRWPEVVAAFKEAGVTRVCVAGPDSLFGRVGITTANFDVVAANPRLAMQPRRRTGTR